MSIASDSDARIPTFHIGDRLQKARTTIGLSQGELADQLGVNRATISRWENGKGVKKSTVLLYAMRTGVDADWLETGYTPRDLNPEPTDSEAAIITGPWMLAAA